MREDVDGGAAQVAAVEGFGEGVDIHHRTARGVDEVAAGFHLRDAFGVDEVLGGGGFGYMQADDVGVGEQGVERGHGAGVAQRQAAFDVVVEHVHAEQFGEDADLRADVAVADDAQGFAAGFVRAGGVFHPAAAMLGGVLFGDAAQQHDDFGQHQFGDAAGVGEGGVEDRDATSGGGGEVDLIGADAEAADGEQVRGFVEHGLGDAGARADADEVGFGNGGVERVAREGGGVFFDTRVAVAGEHADRGRVDAFEENAVHGVGVEGFVDHGACSGGVVGCFVCVDLGARRWRGLAG